MGNPIRRYCDVVVRNKGNYFDASLGVWKAKVEYLFFDLEDLCTIAKEIGASAGCVMQKWTWDYGSPRT
jgi:hypothetical protein